MEKPPKLEIEDVGGAEGMTRQELEAVPHDVYFWECCVKECKHYTRVWDFATAPRFYIPSWRRWADLGRTVLYCGKHWRAFGKRISLLKHIQPEDLAGLEFKEGPGIDHLKIKTHAEKNSNKKTGFGLF